MRHKRVLYAFIMMFVLVVCTGCMKSEESYKKEAIVVTKNEFRENTNKYKDKIVFFYGTVYNVKQNGNEMQLLFDANTRGSLPIVVFYKLQDSQKAFKEGDVVRVWGEFKAVVSDKYNNFATSNTVIEMNAPYVSRVHILDVLHVEGDGRSGEWLTEKISQSDTGGDIEFQTESAFIFKIENVDSVGPNSVDIRGKLTYKVKKTAAEIEAEKAENDKDPLNRIFKKKVAQSKSVSIGYIGNVTDEGVGKCKFVDPDSEPGAPKLFDSGFEFSVKDDDNFSIDIQKIDWTWKNNWSGNFVSSSIPATKTNMYFYKKR